MNASETDLRQRALAALARSEKTRQELVTLLCRHAPEERVRFLVEALAREGLQSDRRAALSRARAAARKGHTVTRMVADLVALGVESSVATEAVEEAAGPRDERADLASAVAALGPSPSRSAALKAARSLVRKGFDPDAVARALSLDDVADAG